MELFAFDDDYVRRLREGDRWTEEHFLSYFQEFLYLKLCRRVRSREDIADCSQEILARVLDAVKMKGEPKDGRRLGSYVNSICNNYLIERFRRDGRTDQLDEKLHERGVEPICLKKLLSEETVERVRRVVGRLPARDVTIVRALLSDRDKDDLCAELGVDRQYLRVLVHRAKEHFKAEYAADVEPIRRGPKGGGPKIPPPDETNSPEPPLPS
jgi:RNA polymerase sigma-70 factor (ECF subfamily)